MIGCVKRSEPRKRSEPNQVINYDMQTGVLRHAGFAGQKQIRNLCKKVLKTIVLWI